MKTRGGHISSKFSESFRIKIAKEYFDSNQSYAEIAKKYELKNLDTVRTMVRWYKNKYSHVGSNEPPKKLSNEEQNDIVLLKQQLQFKDKELSEAKLKLESLNTLIRIAEKSYNINIEKKSGAKQ